MPALACWCHAADKHCATHKNRNTVLYWLAAHRTLGLLVSCSIQNTSYNSAAMEAPHGEAWYYQLSLE